ncbi:MAG: hypothetical protein HY675_03235 [Chloroflexi bacterium]|nr:hypothetical protein [Chloroflexota bacterium]
MFQLCVRCVLLAALLASGFLPLVIAPPTTSAAECLFVMGFRALYEEIPEVVGECKGPERYNVANGDALQETTNGLMVWRKADNFTAFTDGYRTWVMGPEGLQVRLNTERFEWEVEPVVEVVPPGEPSPAPETAPPRSPAPPVARPAPRSLGTGVFFTDKRTTGWGKLAIANKSRYDVVVALSPINNVKMPLVVFYVRGDDEFTVDRVRDGRYYVYFMAGEDWDGNRFTTTLLSERFNEQIFWEVKDNRYLLLRVTLGGEGGRSDATTEVSPGDFPNIR